MTVLAEFKAFMRHNIFPDHKRFRGAKSDYE